MAEETHVKVSVIIPTFNRRESLLRTLESIVRQSYPAERLEVIVVDDGGQDGTREVVQKPVPFAHHYLRQVNQGATAARNRGAAYSKGEYLVFIDDDIELHATTLEVLLDELGSRQETLVLGTLKLPDALKNESLYARTTSQSRSAHDDGGSVPFQECMTGLLAIRRSDFFKVGMFQDPTGGWPNWDDVDFGYRAHLAGMQLWRSTGALAAHWDQSATDLQTSGERWYRASKAAPQLFHNRPALYSAIPMFHDKGPIVWRQDPPTLIGRKLLRQAASSKVVMRVMELAIPVVERHTPESSLLARLYRWVVSGYIYRGYRAGLRLQQDDDRERLNHGPGSLV